ncbi:hypothetical protein CBM2617_U10053 [Cupriavidus taiwanensis]|nr:hypothetical protein CBM2617_U10053 [Cupriavidus taiwanensis]
MASFVLKLAVQVPLGPLAAIFINIDKRETTPCLPSFTGSPLPLRWPCSAQRFLCTTSTRRPPPWN